jgi:predicted DNA-binding transcriptional regulator YafY
MDEVLGASYGIFSGAPTQWAHLRFTPARARWVSAEEWHPDQRVRFEADGSYVLEIPYSDDRELVMDILKHGPEVEIIGPPPLRQRVKDLLNETLQRYNRGARFADLLAIDASSGERSSQ